MTQEEIDFIAARDAWMEHPKSHTPEYDRVLHREYVKAYEARERALSCNIYIALDMPDSECVRCGVSPQFHR